MSPPLSPPPALPPVRSLDLYLETTTQHSLRKLLANCQHIGKPLMLTEMAPICLGSRRRPLSGCSITFPETEQTRSFMKIDGLTNPRRIPNGARIKCKLKFAFRPRVPPTDTPPALAWRHREA